MDQIAHWQQMEARRIEMQEMTNDYDDDDFADEADDIWQKIKSE